MSVKLELEGIESLQKRIEEMGKKANKAVDKALETGAEPIFKDAKNTKAFADRSGKLRKSIKKSKIKVKKGRRVIWIGDVDHECGYSWNVEYGHSRAAAKPFLRPSYEKNKKQAQEIMIKTLREELGL